MVCVSVSRPASEDLVLVSLSPARKQRCLKLKLETKRRSSLSGALFEFGAGNETRTRDPDLGKVVLYQLSYSRNGVP
jgi:hypothetical protein